MCMLVSQSVAMWLVKWYCCCLVLVLVVDCKDPCTSKGSCRECISTLGCVWCSEKVVSEVNDVHCINKSRAVENWCPGGKEDNDTEYHVDEDDTSTQIQPQRARLRLRLGDEHKMEIRFVKAKNYPVDLYYLMDLSKSMEDDKEKISTLGGELTKAMMDLTTNFQLGFGSFVDKTAMPFVSTVPARLKEPCSGCAPPYSFKNHMPLDTNTDRFKDKVKQAPVSGNIDSPEGGFDALMQAMVCTERIKWRKGARRLIVFSTDATFHLAGDGKLAGIIEPNDGLCHMDDNEEYTGGLLYDYPSIAQLDNKAVENNINIIFAVNENQENTYKLLTQQITGSACGKLNASSENVVKLVYDQSKKLTQSVKIIGSVNKRVQLRYYSRCLNPDGELRETDTCDDVKPLDKITFDAHITVTECPPDAGPVWNVSLQFKPVGIEETLNVDLEVICGCDCENNKQQNASMCKGRGTQVCGICECNKGFTGRICECNESEHIDVGDESNCRMDNSSELCSGHGTCRCGVCSCRILNKDRAYSGKYCECDNFSCNRHEGKLCSGPTNGQCICGKCKCSQNWKGDTCQIHDDPKECIDPSTGLVCSNHGKCEDGKCKCNQEYAGKYCEDCVFCPSGRCTKLGNCVECLAYETGTLADSCESSCPNITITELVDKVTEDDVAENEHFCQLPDGSSCTFIFIYHENDGHVNVTAQREKECRGVENVLAVVFGVVGSTILIGLLFILIWKLLTTIHDRREYARFEKERAQAKFDRGENPLYRGAITKFDNPTFNGNEPSLTAMRQT